MLVNFFYCYALDFGQFFGNVGNVSRMAWFSAVGDGGHVGAVRFQEHLVEGCQGGGIPHILGILEGDNSRKAHKDVCPFGFAQFQHLAAKFRSARKAVDMDIFAFQVRVAEYSKGIFAGGEPGVSRFQCPIAGDVRKV